MRPRRRGRKGRLRRVRAAGLAPGTGCRRRRTCTSLREGCSSRSRTVLRGGRTDPRSPLRALHTSTSGTSATPRPPGSEPRPRARPRAPRLDQGRIRLVVPAQELNLRIAPDVVVPIRAGEPRGGHGEPATREPARDDGRAPRRATDEHRVLGRDRGDRGTRHGSRGATIRGEMPILRARRCEAGRSRGSCSPDRPEDASGGCRRARRRHQSAHALSEEARASESAQGVNAPFGRLKKQRENWKKPATLREFLKHCHDLEP